MPQGVDTNYYGGPNTQQFEPDPWQETGKYLVAGTEGGGGALGGTPYKNLAYGEDYRGEYDAPPEMHGPPPPEGYTNPPSTTTESFDWGGLLSDALKTYGGYKVGELGIEGAKRMGLEGQARLEALAGEASGRAQFQPFSVTTGTGHVRTTPEGSIDVGLTRGQEDFRDQLLGQAQGLFGKVGVDPAVAQKELFEQMRAVQRPEEERKRLALEERMLSQGRLGLGSSAYGGSSPELLAQAQAEQEAMARANLGARTQAMSEQAQALLGAQGLLAGGYQPQREVLNALQQGTQVAGLADVGRRAGADLYGQLGAKGVESYLKGADLANRLEVQRAQGISSGLFGGAGGQGGLASTATKGAANAAMKALGFGKDNPTPDWIKDAPENVAKWFGDRWDDVFGEGEEESEYYDWNGYTSDEEEWWGWEDDPEYGGGYYDGYSYDYSDPDADWDFYYDNTTPNNIDFNYDYMPYDDTYYDPYQDPWGDPYYDPYYDNQQYGSYV